MIQKLFFFLLQLPPTPGSRSVKRRPLVNINEFFTMKKPLDDLEGDLQGRLFRSFRLCLDAFDLLNDGTALLWWARPMERVSVPMKNFRPIATRKPVELTTDQHLCGRWHMPDIKNVKEAAIQQLLAGRKPFDCITFHPDQEAVALAGQQRLDAAGLVTELRKRSIHGYHFYHVWDLLACQDIRVQDIGDLRALAEDYAELAEVDVWPYAERALSSFFDDWDSPPLPLWLTGLILGYPVENTISVYLE